MISFAKKIDSLIAPLRQIATTFGTPALDLTIRLYMANIFFTSGWQKFQSWMNGDWESTLFLFRDEHIVPFIPPEIAAVLVTGAEITLPALLAIGLFTRFSAIGLLAITVTIEFFVTSNFGTDFSNSDHYFWMLLLAVPVIYGPRTLSVDHWLAKFVRR